MHIQKDFDRILEYAHFWNWAPDWRIVKEIYTIKPESYSVLTPFAYTYMEEMIRNTTSEYGIATFDNEGRPIKIEVGLKLINLAICENLENEDYVNLLEKTKKYYRYTKNSPDENGRNRVLHGHIHPRFWSKEDFEILIHHIAELSKYSKF